MTTDHIFYTGDAGDVFLGRIAYGSIDCCVTSPPYFGLRRYTDSLLEIGQEATDEEYIRRLAMTFNHVRNALKNDGTLWLNLGDKMHRGELQCIPWRVVMRLQASGWKLRSAVPWVKRSPMPEAVTKRPSNGLEYVFMLTKTDEYFYDADAVRKPVQESTLNRDKYTRISAGKDGQYAVAHDHETPSNPKGRNRRNTDWWVESLEGDLVGFHGTNKSFPGAHFAVMPEGLVRPCILASCREGGTVIDPFCGSGTVNAVAKSLGRNSIGIDLNPEYIVMAKERVLGMGVA